MDLSASGIDQRRDQFVAQLLVASVDCNSIHINSIVWLVPNPHLVAHLIVIQSRQWPSIAHLLITKQKCRCNSISPQ